MNNITLRAAAESDMPLLKEKIMEVFAIAAVERFGEDEADRVPHADELDRAYRLEKSYSEKGYRVHCILNNGNLVGGAVVIINDETRHNKLELFYIFKEYLSQGLGYEAWKAIEREYPETKVWELITPYFEKRNIHFYINKCGFQIVEYFNKYHHDPHEPFPSEETEDDGGYFRFVKEMKEID